MGRSDKILLKDIEQHLVAHREELAGQFHTALRATVFSHRPSIRPSSLKQIAAEEVEGFFNFLRGGETSDIQAQGAKRAHEGIGEAGVLRMGGALRRFCIAHLEDDLQQGGLETSEAYTNDFLMGFAQGREAIILEEQELTRSALQKALGRYTLRLQTASEVSRAVSFTLDLGELLPRMVELVRERFALYYVGVFLSDEIGRYAVLRAGTGEAGREMLAAGHKLELGGQSMIGQCVAGRKARIALDVGQEAVRFDNPVLPQTRSEMALPLVSRGEAIGALTVQSVEAAAFSTEDITLFQTVADQLANAIQNTRLFEQSHLALLRTTALYNVNRSVTTFESLPKVLQQITDGVAGALPADRVLMITFDLDVGEVTHYARGGPGAERAVRVPFEDLWEGLSGWALRELKPALSPKGVPDPREGPEIQEQRIANEAGAIIVVPVLYRGELLGTLTAVNLLSQPDFTEEDVSLMEALASQAATAIQNVRLFEQHQQSLKAAETRAQRLQTVAEVSRVVSFTLDLGELLSQMVELVREQFVLYYVGIFLVDVEGQNAVLRAGTGEAGREMLAADHKLEIGGQSMIGQCVAERKARIALDVGQEAVRFDNPILPQTRSEMALPLVSRGEIIGAVTIQSAEAAAFSTGDITLFRITADQLANAIQNASLFEQTEAALRRTAALYQANRSVMTFESLPEVLQQITDGVAEALPADRVLMLTFDLEARQVTHYSHGGAGAEKLGPASFDNFEEGLSGWVLRELKPAFSPKGALDPRENPRVQQGRIDNDVGSVIVAPVLYREEILGTLTAINSRTQPDFVEEDVSLMEALANQAATAIQNARLFEQYQQSLGAAETRAQRLQTVAEVSRVVSFTLDLGELLSQMVELIRKQFVLYYVGIFLVDAEGQNAVLRAGSGEAGRKMLAAGHKLELGGQSMIGQCVVEQKARIALDVGQEAVRFDNPVLPQTRSEMALPLVSRGEAIGAVTIQSVEAAAFSAGDITLFRITADQLANAIQNASLFEQTEAALLRTMTLYQANRSVTTFESLPEVLQQITDGVAEALPADRVLMITFDLDAGEVTHYARGGIGAERAPRVPFEDLSVGLSGWVLHELKPALSPKGIPDPREGPVVQKQRIANNAGAIIVVPVLYRDELLGTLTAVNLLSQPDFTEEDVTLMEALANQAATAIQNARLFEQTQAALLRTETLYQANRLVTTFESLPEVLRQITDGVAEALPADRVLLLTLDLEARQVTHYAYGGAGAEKLGPASFEHFEGGLTGWVLRELKPAVSPKGDLDPRESPSAQQGRIDNDVGAVIVAPLLYRGEILGTLTAINSCAQPDFTEEDVSLMETLANQAATAVENARLFEQNQQALKEAETRAQRLQAAAEVSRAASSTLEMNELLQQAVMLIHEHFAFKCTGIFLVDDTEQWAILRAGAGEAENLGRRLEVAGESLIGACITQGETQLASVEDTSEAALPLIAHGKVSGAMMVHAVGATAFSTEDIVVLQTMADQLANAITNARLFAESQSRFEELQKLQRQMTGEAWAEYTKAQQVVGYTYDLSQVLPLETPAAVPSIPALSRGEIVTQQGEGGATLLAPITLHGESIGWLNFEETEGSSRDWSSDDIAVIEAVREQLALTLENRLLFEQTATALAETSTLYEIGQHISEAQNAEDILRATVEGLSRRPEPDYVMVGVLEPPETLRIGYDWMRTAAESWRDKVYPLKHWQQLREVIEQEGRFVIDDVENEPRLAEANRHFYSPAGLHGMAAFPLRVQDEIYRTLHIHTTEPHEFSPEELRFYETVIQSAAVALENRILLQTTQQEAARRALLNEVIGTAAASLNPEELLHSVSRLITERLLMPTMIWLWDGKRASPTIIYRHDGTQVLSQEELALRPAEMPGIGKAIRTRGPILWEFAAPPYRSAQFEHLVDALSLQEIFAVPLMIRDTLHGVMVLGRQVGHEAIDDNEMTFMRSAAVNIGVALDNATLYQDAQETAEQLREVDRLKSEFLANMSHELRTPLNSIIGFSRVILKGIDGPLTEFQKTDLEAIYESGRHLLGLINDILDISKIEAGKMEFIFEPVDLRKLIKGTLATSIALVKDKPIELQQDVPEELPIILADERRIRQVVLNLLGNAAKFTEVGFIQVFATYNDREVVVGVKDTGVGIPPEKYDAVFREFEQVDSSSTRRYGGTGLGLPVTKKFVEAHGGRIWFESELGAGSTFYVALPIAGPAPQRPDDVEAQARSDENLTVLTVDDDEGVITLFRRYLEKQGYRVVGLTHSERVVEEAKRLQPYAITLDVIMPDKNGWEVIRELKSDPETRDIPVIICSIVSDTQKGLSLGVTDYLVKPILEQDLLDALERFSEGRDTSHVLVVDDNVDDRKLLRRILEDVGYVVREASGGAEAIVMIIEQPPDLVVLDLMMPEVDGFAVLENLKGHELTRQIPVVVVTAKDLTAEEQVLLDKGVESLLQKALFDQEQLLQDVAAALRRLSFTTGT